MALQIHWRDHVRPQRRRREIDHSLASLAQDWRRFYMRFGAGGIKDDLDLVSMLKKAVDSLGAGRQSQLTCTRQPFRLGNDANHQHRCQHRRALEFVEQIGADVARADDRYWYFLRHTVLSCLGDVLTSSSLITLLVALAAGRCHRAGRETPSLARRTR